MMSLFRFPMVLPAPTIAELVRLELQMAFVWLLVIRVGVRQVALLKLRVVQLPCLHVPAKVTSTFRRLLAPPFILVILPVAQLGHSRWMALSAMTQVLQLSVS
jgi:hypothetical protein